MKTSRLGVCALFVGCLVTAACSRTAGLSPLQYTPNVNSARDREAGPPSYRILHSFGADHDGDDPQGLISIGDTFYSTTDRGGTHGFGTVFSITTGGAERVLHSFGKGFHGRTPYAALIDVGGTLYGTTGYGGGFGYGTVFSISTVGRERVLYSFGNGKDGELPTEYLIDVGGTLYGTTEDGGANSCGPSNDGCGTVFRVTTDGKEKVLHSFGRGTDGRFPAAGLRDVAGTLYGTTPGGGAYSQGTVFSITTAGKENVLYSFRGMPDGAAPTYASLVDLKGILYGTTESGGRHNVGTVYGITRGGSENVLHSFNGIDGNFPAASLVNVGGTLYSTTADGGAYNEGTVFRITTGGSEKVLHSFGKGTDGNAPCCGDLYYKGGSLFGTTQGGGLYGEGVVFSLTP